MSGQTKPFLRAFRPLLRVAGGCLPTFPPRAHALARDYPATGDAKKGWKKKCFSASSCQIQAFCGSVSSRVAINRRKKGRKSSVKGDNGRHAVPSPRARRPAEKTMSGLFAPTGRGTIKVRRFPARQLAKGGKSGRVVVEAQVLLSLFHSTWADEDAPMGEGKGLAGGRLLDRDASLTFEEVQRRQDVHAAKSGARVTRFKRRGPRPRRGSELVCSGD